MSHTKQDHGGIGRILHWFAHSPMAGSLLLLVCTIVALVWANSQWVNTYNDILHMEFGLSLGDHEFKGSIHHWINDGLMVIFFFAIGLEIKREVVVGQLSDTRKAILPVAAAIGGMVVPAILYIIFNAGGEGAAGWGVPMATDIAFALGILALFGKRVPIGLKVFLTALAIADDLGAVLVIAMFYTAEIDFTALLVAVVFMAVLAALNHYRVRRLTPYLVVLVVIWVAVFASGIHATVAGILMAMMMPIKSSITPEKFFEITEKSLAKLKQTSLSKVSMLENKQQMNALWDMDRATEDMRPSGLSLEQALHPIQALIILPIFALANAGVPLGAGIMEALSNPVSIGIIAGLFLGKQIGITLFCWIAIKSRKASLPDGVTWGQVWGAGCVAGVGFTMSLFVSGLAFDDASMIANAKVGILAASLLSGVMGYFVLNFFLPRTKK